MKSVKFIPKYVTGWTDKVKDESGKEIEIKRAPTYKGCVTLKVPNYFERQKLKNILVGAISRDGETDIDTLKMNSKKVNVANALEKVAMLVEQSVPFYEAVELENIETGVILKSFEELSCDADAEGILQEVAQELATGLKLSKN